MGRLGGQLEKENAFAQDVVLFQVESSHVKGCSKETLQAPDKPDVFSFLQIPK